MMVVKPVWEKSKDLIGAYFYAGVALPYIHQNGFQRRMVGSTFGPSEVRATCGALTMTLLGGQGG